MWRLACIAAVTLALAPATAGAAYPGANGMIGFSRHDSGEWFVGTLNPDGSGLAVGGTPYASPEFSPDGNRELVFAFGGGAASIATRAVDGTGLTPIDVPDGNVFNARWSPDGARIAYMLSQPGNGADAEVWTMAADGTDRRQVTADGFAKFQLDYGQTPAGPKIAYVGAGGSDPADPCYGWQLRLMDPDGGNAVCVASVAAYGQDLAYSASGDVSWSPDGTKIAFVASYGHDPVCAPGGNGCATHEDIWVADLAAGTVKDVSNTSGLGQVIESSVAWSPDGTKLVTAGATPYVANGALAFKGERLYVMPAGGGALTPITPEPAADATAHDSSVDWQPCVAGVTKTCTSVTPPGGVEGGGGDGTGTGGDGTGGGSGTTPGTDADGPVVHVRKLRRLRHHRDRLRATVTDAGSGVAGVRFGLTRRLGHGRCSALTATGRLKTMRCTTATKRFAAAGHSGAGYRFTLRVPQRYAHKRFRLVVVAADGAGNVTRARATVRL